MKEDSTKNPIPDNPLKIDCYKMGCEGWDIVPASSVRDWMEATNGHAQKCLPLLSANQMGWHILCPVDFSAIWDGGPMGPNTKILMDNPAFEKAVVSHFGVGIITFQLPYFFRTSPEIGLFARGPTNFWIDNFHALDGFIETHWSNYSFTLNWKITKPHTMIHVKKGDPICMLIPYPVRLLENVQITHEPFHKAPEELRTTYEKWSKYRDEFNQRTNRTKQDWQKDYFMGRKCPFSGNGPENKGEPHRTKFHLPRFDECQ